MKSLILWSKLKTLCGVSSMFIFDVSLLLLAGLVLLELFPRADLQDRTNILKHSACTTTWTHWCCLLWRYKRWWSWLLGKMFFGIITEKLKSEWHIKPFSWIHKLLCRDKAWWCQTEIPSPHAVHSLFCILLGVHLGFRHLWQHHLRLIPDVGFLFCIKSGAYLPAKETDPPCVVGVCQ